IAVDGFSGGLRRRGVSRSPGRLDDWGNGCRLLQPFLKSALLSPLACHPRFSDRGEPVSFGERSSSAEVRVSLDLAAVFSRGDAGCFDTKAGQGELIEFRNSCARRGRWRGGLPDA